jgi:putative transposase
MTYNSYHIPEHLYFITATICGWNKLFVEESYSSIVLNSIEWLRQQGRMDLYAFVLMPSHLHTIVKPKDRAIGRLLKDFGSFTAHDILKELKNEERSDLIQFFHQERRDKRHEHSIWQDIQAQNIFSPDFLRQKLDYIHNNPIDKNWRLVRDRADYRFSSACFYDRGIQPMIEIDDVRDLLA